MGAPTISDYALIGNGQTAALVSRYGSIDWCCWPRFDSSAVFCRLLDYEQGGYYEVVPRGPYQAIREYVDQTNIHRITFTTEQGVLQLTDFMPAPLRSEGERIFPHRIVRRAECLEGQVEMCVTFAPTFDFARLPARWETVEHGVVASTDHEALALRGHLQFEPWGQAYRATETLAEGQSCWLDLMHGDRASVYPQSGEPTAEAEQEFLRTVDYWQEWADQCRYQGPYRKWVVRSALALKLLVYQPTGGLIAAATTSLPAELGGVRNWDYRYTWLRDAGLVLDALQQLGYHQESIQFIEWLENLRLDGDDALRVMYTPTGEPAPQEQHLDHLAGYRNSQPVRAGNDAVSQIQIDAFGHILDAVVLCFEKMPRTLQPDVWDFLKLIANRAAANWDRPDHGPWEVPGPPRHYLFSKLYCWVGLDRAIRFAEKHRLSGDLAHWRKQRDALRETILQRGYHPTSGAFTQTFDSDVLDASALAIPLTDFLPIDDPRMQSTLQQIEEHLTRDGLVYRYLAADNLPGHDSTFTLCSFWLVGNLALAGERDRAEALFQQICGHANDLGLLSEQIDADSGELRGNFPQGFAHLGLIRAALYLNPPEG